jgi:hypothetical protein
MMPHPVAKRLLLLSVAVAAVVITSPAEARSHASGWVERGGQSVLVSGLSSSTKVQASYPVANVYVCARGFNCLTDASNRAVIYSDSAGTAKTNPFAASSTAYWDFYADASSYDLMFDGLGVSYTLRDYTMPAIATDFVPGSARAFGDSIMLGSGLAASQGIVPTVSTSTLWTIDNEAISGSLIADAGQADLIFASSVDASYKSFILSGYNDMRAGGTAASNLAAYRGDLAALSVWLAIPDSNKLRGTSSAITYTGAWSTVPGTYGGNLLKLTSTGGNTAAATVQGSVVYIGAVGLNSGGGTFDVTIDGVDFGTYSCSSAILTPAGRNYAPFLVRIPGLGNTKHAVTITHNGAGQIFIAYIASNAAGQSVAGPSVWIGNCLRMNATGYTLGGGNFDNGSDAAVALYNGAIRSTVEQLSGDGLNVSLVDAASAYDPDTSDVQSDNIHPSASGAAKIGGAFLVKMVKNAYGADHNPAPVRSSFVGRGSISVSAQTIGSGTPAAVTGAALPAFIAPADGTLVVHGDFDVQETSIGLFIGYLYSNAAPATGLIGWDSQAIGARSTQSHTWDIPVVGGSSYALALYASANSGSFTLFSGAAANTRLTALFLPNR